jgi:arginine:agmatine antiporter
LSNERGVGPLAATVLVAGNMIGSGVFMLPASLAATGSSTVLSWLITSAGALALAGVFAALATIRPTPDAIVDYPARGLHPFFGFANWWLYLLACWIGVPAVALAATGYLAYFLPAVAGPLPGAWTTIGIIWLLTVANIFGAKLVTRLSGLTLLIGLAPIVVATVLGLLAFDSEIFAAGWNVSGKPLSVAVGQSLAPVFWAFLGIESASFAAAVVRDPERNVARASLGGVALAAVIYIGASVALLGSIPTETLAKSTAPFADAIRILWGPAAASVIAVCALLKTLGTVGGWMLVTAEGSRSGAAAGYLPRILSQGDATRAPVRDLMLAAVLMSGVLLASVSPTLGKQFGVLINITVNFSMVAYTLCSLALIRIARDISDPGRRRLLQLLGLAGATFAVTVLALSDPSMLPPTLWAVAATVPLYGLVLLARRGAGRGQVKVSQGTS